MGNRKRFRTTESNSSQSSYGGKITQILNDIKHRLENMDSVENVLAWSKTEKIALPFIGLPKTGSIEREKLRFSAQSPANIVVVGSFLLNTSIAPANVDLAVEIPTKLLEIKEELNYRYFLKRAFFLARIIHCLRNSEQLNGASFAWVPFRGHVLKPTIAIRPLAVDVEIRIHTYVNTSKLRLYRFGPGRNSVRSRFLLKTENPLVTKTEKGFDKIIGMPTPIYNSLILTDILMIEHLKLLHKELKQIPALVDAIKLGKAWILQRKYNEYAFQLNGFQFSMLCAYLSSIGRIDTNMNEIQIFRMIMEFIVENDFGTVTSFKPLNSWDFIPKDCINDYSIEAYNNAFAATLIEPFAGLNLLFDWTAETVALVKLDARRTLELLSSDDPHQWESLFLKSDHPLNKFDTFYRIGGFDLKLDADSNFSHYADEFKPQVARLKMVSKKLKFALGSRAKEILIMSKYPNASPINQYQIEFDEVTIGLIIDRDACQKLIELGPLADTDEAKTFRYFWGKQAELRRFQDGSIREVVSWEDLSDRRHLIVQEIVRFVFNNQLQTEEIRTFDNCLDFAWSPNALFMPVSEALESLTKKFKEIDDLPLAIIKCEPISPNGRMTSIYVPLRNGQTIPSPVIEILIHFEESTRWPGDYYGVLYSKQAFLVQICRRLYDMLGLSTSITDDYFDVEYKGLIFRCFIYVDSEVRLMKSQGLDCRYIEIRNDYLPMHSKKVFALVQANLIYGPVVRLVKKWIIGLMYAKQIPDELIELIVANVFTSSKHSPNTVITAFYRVLDLILNHRWETTPLFVSFEGDESKNWSQDRAQKSFDADRNRPLLWVSTSYETSGDCCIWSKLCTLSADDLAYLKELAKAALDMLDFNSSTLDATILFQSSHHRFDLVVKLSFSAKRISRLAMKFITQGPDFMTTLPGFDPLARLITDIENIYPGLCLYHGGLETDFIGIIATEKLKKDLTEVSKGIETKFAGFVSSVEIIRK